LFRGLGSTVGTAVLGTMLITGITNQLGAIGDDPYIQSLKQQPAASQFVSTVTTDTALNLNTADFKETVADGVEKATRTLPLAEKSEIKQAFANLQTSFSDRIVTAFSDSLRNVFYTASALMLAATILAGFVLEKPLRGGPDDTPGMA
jgi:hypothetical protein